MKEKSTLIPPYGAEKLASKLVPPEYGTSKKVSNVLNPVSRKAHTHGYPVSMANFGDLRYLLGRFGICDSDGELLDVD